MTLRLEDRWVWDSWPFTDDAGLHHLFFLQADRSLVDPHLRHTHPSIGHAVSEDYRNWTILPDALAPRSTPGWDDSTTWTGSVVKGPSGRYHMFYTGTSRAENTMVQRIGRADSDDLIHWERFGEEALLEADPRWYERYEGGIHWHDEAFRDPWVMPDPEGNGWHMFITARVSHGDPYSRGVVGHAWSADLDEWEVRPPLSSPGPFGHMEVFQYVEIDGVSHLVFCCGPEHYNPALVAPGTQAGVWLIPGDHVLGPWDATMARRVDHESLYAARVITDVDGVQRLLGFSNEVDGRFVGEILDPVDIALE